METNILIDDLPTDYNGYLINYTFKSGILISECLNDKNFKDEREKVYTALRILFGPFFPLGWSVRAWSLPQPMEDTGD